MALVLRLFMCPERAGNTVGAVRGAERAGDRGGEVGDRTAVSEEPATPQALPAAISSGGAADEAAINSDGIARIVGPTPG